MSEAAVPVTVEPEAAARVKELGMEAQLQKMVDHALEVLPALRRIEVTLAERYDTGGEPGVSIKAYSDAPFDPADRISWDWHSWLIDSFPPTVYEHLAMLLYQEAG
jgi:hypothetical protein